jgi:hypothetical protein
VLIVMPLYGTNGDGHAGEDGDDDRQQDGHRADTRP